MKLEDITIPQVVEQIRNSQRLFGRGGIVIKVDKVTSGAVYVSVNQVRVYNKKLTVEELHDRALGVFANVNHTILVKADGKKYVEVASEY
jgi:hypothetical protein